jgi:methyl-accepting chemotaxis protein
MKNIDLKTKLILLVVVPTIFCTALAIFIASVKIRNEGERALREKSTAILSRMEAVRHFVANQGMLEYTIQEMIKKYPDGNLSPEDKQKILNQVPIMASMKVGLENSEEENYVFRIATDQPRNPKNMATPEELEFLANFSGNNTLIHKDEEANTYQVMRPVYLREAEGCLKCHGKPETSPWGNGTDILGHKMEGWKDGELRGMFKIVSDIGPVQARVNSAIMNIAFWGLGISILAILLGIRITGKISLTIQRLIGVTEKIARGDLNNEIKVESTDELGKLGNYINIMSRSLKKVLLEIRESSERLTQATEEISSSSQQISEGAQKQAAEFEEISSSIQSTANSSLSANDETRKSSSEAGDTEKAVMDSITAMNKIKNSSGKIGEAIKIISDLAYQTNLLALNAAIEAARAGEHGKGFTVVAKEVKKLAEKSAESARDISENIMVTLKDIEKGVQTSESAGKKIKSIIESVNNVAKEIESITAASQQQATAIETNTRIVTGNAASAEQLAASSGELAEQARMLNEIVEKFVLDDQNKEPSQQIELSDFTAKTYSTINQEV